MTQLAPLLVFLLLAAPGVRLIWLASRTRQAPELWCGLYFLGAAIGISLRIFGTSIQWVDSELALRINTLGHLAFAGGTIAMVVFTQKVFHPSNAGARAFAAFVIAAIIGTTSHTLFSGDVAVENSYSLIATNAARIVPTGWAFLESLRYWMAMRKRGALGLADPIVTNRFLLWSCWTGGVSILPLIALSARTAALVMLGDRMIEEATVGDLAPKVMATIRVSFLLIVPVSVVSLWLSFFPPRGYLARIRGGANPTAARSPS